MLDLPQRSRVLGGRLARPLRKEQTGAADAYKRHQCRLFIYKSIKLFKGMITLTHTFLGSRGRLTWVIALSRNTSQVYFPG